MRPPLIDQVREEQSWTAPPEGVHQTRVIRWLLLQGEALTAAEVRGADGQSGPGLTGCIHQLQRLGFTFVSANEARAPGEHQGRPRVRWRCTNPDHPPVERERAAPVKRFRPGGLADVAAALLAAHPEGITAADLPALSRKQVVLRLNSLRKLHGWEVSLAEPWRLVRMPDHAPPPPGTAAVRHVATAAPGPDLGHFLRDPATAPALGTVLRATMVAEDNGSAVMVLSARDGDRWYVRVEGVDTGVPG